MHALLQAVRAVDNRHCAECDFQIGDISSVFAVLDFGVWVCNECANSFMETEVLTNSESLKTCAEEWVPEDIDHMLLAISNKAVNNIYERHVLPSWKKPTPEASRMERVNWILAKYKAKLFVFPQKKEPISSAPLVASDRSSGLSMDFCPETTELPMRLLDFFVVVSPGDQVPTPEGAPGEEEERSHIPQVEEMEFTPVISSCFPEPDTLPDTPLPEHLGMFIYPNGATLSSKEVPPTFFTFVLTDTSGVKLFGGVLHIYELMEPAEVRSMLHFVPTTSKYIYVPKALVVLSHYPFFHLFYNILKQLYRISLSSCPLAMEKYLTQVITETPLPPPGSTRVVFPLADSMLMVSRPPRNQLPMIDFSYRPLFSRLSVNNILSIFSFICAEHKVCFASKFLSILTPIQESFLSFLFPLVWQGAYIPVMPATMLDLLDAPVPMLLGVERCQIFEGNQLKPWAGGGVVIVDLDRDEVLVGCDDYGKQLEPIQMHAKDLGKLKDKLVEFGGCIHRTAGDEQYVEDTLKAFPQNEHLQPIQTFVSLENGVRIPFIQKSKDQDESVSVQSTYFFRDTEAASSSSGPDNMSRVSILSPESNTSTGNKDSFNAKEIRRAFLRFFVSSLRDMHSDNIRSDRSGSESAGGDGGKKASVVAAKKKKKEMPELTKFMTELMNTQMLTFFSEERIYHTDHAEVKFFDESILDKLNRSVTTVNKMTTPFLDDKSEYIHELYFCFPCRAKSQDKHVYPRFPEIIRGKDASLPTKKVKILQREAEHRRKHDAKNQLHAVDLAITVNHEKNSQSPSRRSSFSLSRKADSSVMKHVCAEGEARFLVTMASLILIQTNWRMAIAHRRKSRRSHTFESEMDDTRVTNGIVIQKYLRGFMSRLQYKRRRAATMIQKTVRGFVRKHQYERSRRGIRRLQATSRMRVARNKYRNIILHISIFQARFKSKRAFKDIYSKRISSIITLRRMIFQLWTSANTPLEYRSQFWSFVGKTSFFHLSFHIDEVKSLWKSLQYDTPMLKCLRNPEIFASLDKLEQYVTAKSTVRPESQDILSERKKFYTLMKSGIKNIADQSRYFDTFCISSKKKRKQDLTNLLLWKSMDTADQSAAVVLDMLATSSPLSDRDKAQAQQDWIKKQNAVRPGAYSMLSVVQALMRRHQVAPKVV